MKLQETLKFELSAEQKSVLNSVGLGSAAAADGPPEESYRAWNSSFVDPETKPEPLLMTKA